MTDLQISFCTTCMGRLHHLKHTLPENIQGNFESGVEFVLVDYSSDDGLADWVSTNFAGQIQNGFLVYLRIDGKRRFLPAHAKNVAHRCARGKILCNVDADNYIGIGFASFLREIFASQSGIFVAAAGKRGATGRIAILKSHFNLLGGYNEEMINGYGFEDVDLRRRAKLMGLRPIRIVSPSPYLKVIQHSNFERTVNTGGIDVRTSIRCHRTISRGCINNAIFRVNQHRQFGSAVVTKNFNETLVIGGAPND